MKLMMFLCEQSIFNGLYHHQYTYYNFLIDKLVVVFNDCAAAGSLYDLSKAPATCLGNGVSGSFSTATAKNFKEQNFFLTATKVLH
jgi:hypothetical protein